MTKVKLTASDHAIVKASTETWMQGVASGDIAPYGLFVEKLFKNMGSDVNNLMHAAIGMSGEAGEVLDHAKKAWANGIDLNMEKFLKEMGDTRFYYQALLNHFGLTDNDIKAMNVAKLSTRYPTGHYSDADAKARVDKLTPMDKEQEKQLDAEFWNDPAFAPGNK